METKMVIFFILAEQMPIYFFLQTGQHFINFKKLNLAEN